nr:extensin-1-like [Ipomoea trifida]
MPKPAVEAMNIVVDKVVPLSHRLHFAVSPARLLPCCRRPLSLFRLSSTIIMPADSGRTDAGMTVSPAAYYARPITAYYARPITAYYARPINAYYARPITVLTASGYYSLRGMAENRPIPAANVDEADPSIKWVKVEHMGDLVKFKLALPLLKDLKAAVKSRFRHLKTRGTVLKFTYKDQEGNMIVIACDEDLKFCFEYFNALNRTVRLSLVAIYR